jgi:acyl CoA:acetate/3-ketoacid CoA transferase beta subunit
VSDYTREEMMTIAAARLLWDGCVCFVGIGLPSAACNLARLTHAPGIVLIYESGTIGTRPEVLPLSIGDGELAETAACVVPLPEVFSYYLQAGRIDVGFLGAAQIDRHGNLNSTVIGPYDRPATRLPGAGGAPEIAAHARQTFVVMKATPRSFVPRLDFCTSAGFLDGHGARGRSGATGAGHARSSPTSEYSRHGPGRTSSRSRPFIRAYRSTRRARLSAGRSQSRSPRLRFHARRLMNSRRFGHCIRARPRHTRDPVHIPNRSFSDVSHPESHRG